MKIPPLVVDYTYDARAQHVWKAITDPAQMKQWFFEVSAFEPTAGFEFTFEGKNEGKIFIHLCKVIEVIVNKKLSFSWRYENYQGNSTVTIDLIDEGYYTHLRLTHEGIESFPPTKDFARESFMAGWTYIVGTGLQKFLEKQEGRT